MYAAKKVVCKIKHLCYDIREVNNMENEILEQEIPEEETQEKYVPRPKWQVVGAWVLLALFITLLVMYYANIFRGGA